MPNINHMLQQAALVRDAKIVGENTANRVGALLVDIVNMLGAPATVDLTSYLPRLEFDDMFEWVAVGTQRYIRAKSTLVADGNLVALYKGDEAVTSYATVEMLGQYATKTELQEALAGLGTGGIDTTELQQYLTEHHYITSSQLPDLSKYALKTEIPSLAGLAKQTWVSENYQPKGNYLTSSALNGYATQTWVGQSLADYYNKTAVDTMLTTINNSIASVESALGDKLDAVTFDEMFEWVTVGTQRFIRAKATLVSVGNLVALYKGDDVPSSSVGLDLAALESYLEDNNYVTKDWVLNQGFITGLAGYATESWVNSQGFLKQHQSLANYVTINTAQEIVAGKTFHSTYLKLIGNNLSNTANRHSSGVLSFQENNYDDQFGIWGYFNGIGTAQKLFIGGSGTGTSLGNDQAGTVFTPYLTIEHTTGNLTVLGKIIKSGGTSSQFLKADGSVDSNSYALASALGSYLRKDTGNVKTIGKSVDGINAINNDANTWASNYTLSLVNANNALNFYVGGGENERKAMIQVGHSSPAYAQYLGILHLNKLGGAVYINNSLALTAANYSDTLDTRYVKKSGDTMTGALNVQNGVRLIYANNLGYLQLGDSTNKAGTITSMNGVALTSLNILCANNALTTNGNVLWHAGNDGSGSGLDADLLDGYHEDRYFRMLRSQIPTAYIDLTDYNAGATGYANYAPGTYQILCDGHSELFVNLALNNGGSTSALQFKTSYSDSTPLYFRKTIDSNRVSGPWRTILTELNIDSYNAGSATRLQGTYSLWGQSFFGNDVSGNMTGVGSITFADASAVNIDIYGNLKFKSVNTACSWSVKTYGGVTALCCKNDGYVGIGTSLPQYPVDIHNRISVGPSGFNAALRCYHELHTSIEVQGGNYTMGLGCHSNGSWYWWRGTNGAASANKSYVMQYDGSIWSFTGTIKASGNLVALSDMRVKSHITDLEWRGRLQPKRYWKDGRWQIGFIAQDVDELYSETVFKSNLLSLDYGALTAVLAAQVNNNTDDIVAMKEQIRNLEIKVETLEAENKQFKQLLRA